MENTGKTPVKAPPCLYSTELFYSESAYYLIPLQLLIHWQHPKKQPNKVKVMSDYAHKKW